MVKSIPTLLRSYCVRKMENSALQHVFYVCAVLSEQDTLQGASDNPHGHATTRPAGWHYNIAEFAAADGENHG